MWIIVVKGTPWALGAVWETQDAAQKACDNLVPKHGEEYEVVFQELTPAED